MLHRKPAGYYRAKLSSFRVSHHRRTRYNERTGVGSVAGGAKKNHSAENQVGEDVRRNGGVVPKRTRRANADRQAQ